MNTMVLAGRNEFAHAPVIGTHIQCNDRQVLGVVSATQGINQCFRNTRGAETTHGNGRPSQFQARQGLAGRVTELADETTTTTPRQTTAAVPTGCCKDPVSIEWEHHHPRVARDQK
eukprot:scaffold6615_cov172-Amphora_coffeaeformis.AAC.9